MKDLNKRGIRRRLPGHRRMVSDFMSIAKKIPSIPVARTMRLAAVAAARNRCEARPSWTSLFMKAYAFVCQRNPKLRQTLIAFPWEHLYEHPISLCQIAIEREMNGEKLLLPAQLRAPDCQTLPQINDYLQRCKHAPVDSIGYFRRVFEIGGVPRPFRRMLWWMTCNLSGFKRAKRLGTFGISSYGRLGAEQLHPLSPQTTILTFGPISQAGEVVVKIIYDHRVLDGSDVARRLAELDDTLHTEIIRELSELNSAAGPSVDASPRAQILQLRNDAA